MSRSKISEAIQDQLRQRARYLCEFCHADERWQYVKFTVDHLTPLSLAGDDDPDNLALACFHCNRRKTNRLFAIDPLSAREVALFNPRQDPWNKHFIWSADMLTIIGKTEIGRATVSALLLNRERVIPIRVADLAIGRHPPAGDLVEC
jgi:HNH endonuclease